MLEMMSIFFCELFLAISLEGFKDVEGDLLSPLWSLEAQAFRSGDIQSAENFFADTTRITDSSVNDSLLLHAL